MSSRSRNNTGAAAFGVGAGASVAGSRSMVRPAGAVRHESSRECTRRRRRRTQGIQPPLFQQQLSTTIHKHQNKPVVGRGAEAGAAIDSEGAVLALGDSSSSSVGHKSGSVNSNFSESSASRSSENSRGTLGPVSGARPPAEPLLLRGLAPADLGRSAGRALAAGAAAAAAAAGSGAAALAPGLPARLMRSWTRLRSLSLIWPISLYTSSPTMLYTTTIVSSAAERTPLSRSDTCQSRRRRRW